MDVRGIYQELKKKSVGKPHFFGRKLFVVDSSIFDEYKKYFEETINIFNKKTNYRTPTTFRHIHAVKTGSLVEFHYDFGNLNKSFIMAIPHFFLDVIPYFLYHLITFKKPYEIDPRNIEKQTAIQESRQG